MNRESATLNAAWAVSVVAIATDLVTQGYFAGALMVLIFGASTTWWVRGRGDDDDDDFDEPGFQG